MQLENKSSGSDLLKELKFSDVAIISGALFTCFLFIALDIFVANRFRFDLITLNAGFIPYGAITAGLIGTSGALLVAKIAKRSIARITFQSIPVISLLAYLSYHYWKYIISEVSGAGNVARAFDIVCFLRYVHISIAQRVYVSPGFMHNTNPARFGGYLFACIEIFGFWVGSFITIEYLKKIHKKYRS